MDRQRRYIHGLGGGDGDGGMGRSSNVPSRDDGTAEAELIPPMRSAGTFRTGDVATERPARFGADADATVPSAGLTGRGRLRYQQQQQQHQQLQQRQNDQAQSNDIENLDDSLPLLSPNDLPTPRSSSGDDLSDDERRRQRAVRDMRKYENAATPTLVDEDDYPDAADYDGDGEEQEMVSFALEHHVLRARRSHFASIAGAEDPSLRRTPGAQMYRSAASFDAGNVARRAVGTSATIHGPPKQQHGQRTPDASGLGFGLTLSGNVSGASRPKADNEMLVTWGQSQAAESGSSATSHPGQGSAQPSSKTYATRSIPRYHHHQQQQQHRPATFASPWAAKNPPPDRQQNSYSPNTLRLTEDLGNLLLDDEDATTASSVDFKESILHKGGRLERKQPHQATTDIAENWTSSYIISADDSQGRNSRASTESASTGTSGRSRRGRNESGRRSRGFERVSGNDTRRHPTSSVRRPNTFAPLAQHPGGSQDDRSPFLQEARTAFVVGNDTGRHVGSSNVSAPVDSRPGSVDDLRSSPRLLNFGGSLMQMPDQSYANFVRPVASAPSIVQPRVLPYQPHPHPAQFGTLGQRPFIHHNPFIVAPIPSHPRHFNRGMESMQQPQQQEQQFQSQPPSQQQEQQPAFVGQTEVLFAQPHGIAQNPGFALSSSSGVMAYAAHPGGATNRPQEYVVANVPVHHQQQANAVPAFGHATQQSVWQPTMPSAPISFERASPFEQSGWHGAQQQGWQPTGMTFGQIQQPARPTSTQSAVTETAANPFAVPTTASKDQKRSGPGRGTARGKNRGKNQRKGSARRGARHQNRADKVQRDNDSEEAPNLSGKKSLSAHSKIKKKQAKDKSSSQGASGQTHSNQISVANNDSTPSVNAPTPVSASAVASQKKSELTESQATRAAFKDFYRKFRTHERTSSQAAEQFAIQSLKDGALPQQVHWKVYLELADLAKRTNRFTEARQLYRKVCELQPYASQGWLEYSKLEEECGNMNMCARILRAGLEYCEYSESLITRAVKHEEKTGNLTKARELLARLKHVGIDKVFRTVLEGALLEARAGNDVMARRVLKYLMHHVPWYGPLYLEAYRLEKDLGQNNEALAIVNKGLAAIPKYGPLWFGAFRLCEALDLGRKDYELSHSMAMIDQAITNISKELIWKVHLEAAHMLERSTIEHLEEGEDESVRQSLMERCRKRFALTILTCPPNLRWKVWLASGRMELATGRPHISRRLFLRAHKVVPDKGRAVALLEWARLEEFVGDSVLASAILCKSRAVAGSDWKVWFESVLLETRRQNYERAVELARQALRQHSGTGRLWASLVQLCHFDGGEEAQVEALKGALSAVPKSGEVWCEGSRIHLNPFSRIFDTKKARRHLLFATRFTPQYGDGFLETLRLELVDQWILPIARLIWESTQRSLRTSTELDSHFELRSYLSRILVVTMRLCNMSVLSGTVLDDKRDRDDVPRGQHFVDGEVRNAILQRLRMGENEGAFDVSHLELRCANADPNYGSMWFHCRYGPTDTARRVLKKAQSIIIGELQQHAMYYIVAFVRRYAVAEIFAKRLRSAQIKSVGPATAPISPQNETEWDTALDKMLLSAPALQDIVKENKEKPVTLDGVGLLESTMAGSDFITGLIELNRQTPMDRMTLSQRRKALFGTDALFP